MGSLSELIETKKIIVCCGSGGVGKTTMSAAFGVAGALSGRKVCVITIDPARRLADVLSAGALTNTPRRLPGDFRGELSAVMLDARATFDDLIARYAKDADQAERITSNAMYANLISSLSGIQEFMATEKLYELVESQLFDLVVVDTPPTRAALDFLEAPNRLGAFLDNRVFRTIMGSDRGIAKAFNLATRALLQTFSRLIGGDFVDDTMTFFQAFSGMEAGFKERAAHVGTLLAEASTAYALVTSPRRDAMDEAEIVASHLRSAHHDIDALVVNRVHPDFGLPTDQLAHFDKSSAFFAFVANWSELSTLATEERRLVADLTSQTGATATAIVPILTDDVHDLDALLVVARHLISDELPFDRGKDPHRQ